MKSKILILAFICLFSFSCKKDKVAPTLIITSPASGATINGMVTITGTVADDELHEMTITIKKNSDGSILYTKDISVHDLTSYNFHETFTPTGILVPTEVTLTIVVEDHIPNTTTKNVVFQLLP